MVLPRKEVGCFLKVKKGDLVLVEKFKSILETQAHTDTRHDCFVPWLRMITSLPIDQCSHRSGPEYTYIVMMQLLVLEKSTLFTEAAADI